MSESKLEKALGGVATERVLCVASFLLLVRVVNFFPVGSVALSANNAFSIMLSDYPIEIKFIQPLIDGLWRCDVTDKGNFYEQSIKCENIDFKDVRKIIDRIIHKFYANKDIRS